MIVALRSRLRRAGITTTLLRPPESAISAMMIIQNYKKAFGVFPNLLYPRTYNEKVLHRMLFDRRPVWTHLQDKYAVREYVKERIGADILARLYWVTKDPSDIPFDDLPDKFVAKPTHGSGWFYLVPDKASLHRQDLIDRCTLWMSQNYYYVFREWVYKHIEPRIIVEELIEDASGSPPHRYKLHVFDGRVQVVTVMTGGRDDIRCDFYGREWNRFPAAHSLWKNRDQPLPRPTHLEEMMGYAEVLGAGLDYVRVDLYDAGDKVHFGEMTTTPGAGNMRFTPDEFDRYLGGFWKRSSRRRTLQGPGG